MLGNKLKVIADTIFGEEVVKSKANEFVQEREDTGLAGIKLDFSHKLLYRFQSSLYGIRNSMTGTWHRVKSAVMPGRRVSSDEIARLGEIYNNLQFEEQPTNGAQVMNVQNAKFDGLDLEPLEVGNRLDTVGVAPSNTVSTQKNGIEEEEVSKSSRISRLQQVLQGKFAKIKFERNAKELDKVIARQEEKLKEDIDTPSLTVPAVSEKIGLVQRITDLFKNLFSARATESSKSVQVMYGNTSTHANAWKKGEYVSNDTEINYPSLNSTTSQGRAETPPPAYEEVIQGHQPSKQLDSLSADQVLKKAAKDIEKGGIFV